MKKISILFLALSATLFSCSSSDDNNNNNTNNPEFAMTAKINGTTYQANDPFNGNNFATTNIWDYFPMEDFVLLQSRQGGTFGTPEINLWLKRSDIAVGTYQIGQETFDTPPSHFIDLIDITNSISENTKEGTVVITSVNTSTKIVKGTFTFKTVDDLSDPNAPIDYTVTDGTFNYKYE